MSKNGRLYFGGSIVTMDPAYGAVEAVAERDGRIAAAGARADCEAALGPDFEPVDLAGRTLLPGFIDTHIHPVPLIFYDMNLDLRQVRSMAELQAKIRELAAARGDGSWIIGLQFDEQNLAEQRMPTRHELDAACARPVLILKTDGHTNIANTAAIRAAGVTAATPDPAGGVIDREPGGFPSGAFRENAAPLTLAAMPVLPLESLAAGAASAFAKLASHGITSMGAMLQTGPEGPAGPQGAFDVPLMQMLLPHVPISLYSMLITRDIAAVAATRKTPLHDDPPGAGHRVGGVKIFLDGTLGSCTAYMREPFANRPGTRGMLTIGMEEFRLLMRDAHAAGLQVAVHTIGDAACRLCLDLFDETLRDNPGPHRHRMEHASILDARMIADMARLGITAAVQPMFIHSENHWLEKRVGAERADMTYAFRAMMDAGVTLAGASDAPVESTDVLHAIQICVTRDGFRPRQCLTPMQALRMFTINAAFAQEEEMVKGSITPGKRADFVLLSGNPLNAPPDKIRDIRLLRTICGGKTIFED